MPLNMIPEYSPDLPRISDIVYEDASLTSIIYSGGSVLTPMYIVGTPDGLAVILASGRFLVGSVYVIQNDFPSTKYYNVNYDGTIRQKFPEYVHVPLIGRSTNEQDPVFIDETMVDPIVYVNNGSVTMRQGKVGMATSLFVDVENQITYDLNKKVYHASYRLPDGDGSFISIVSSITGLGYEILYDDFHQYLVQRIAGNGRPVLRTKELLTSLEKFDVISDLEKDSGFVEFQGGEEVTLLSDFCQLAQDLVFTKGWSRVEFMDHVESLTSLLDFSDSDVDLSDRKMAKNIGLRIEEVLLSVEGSNMFEKIGNFAGDVLELVVLMVAWSNRNYISHYGTDKQDGRAWLNLDYASVKWKKYFSHSAYYRLQPYTQSFMRIRGSDEKNYNRLINDPFAKFFFDIGMSIRDDDGRMFNAGGFIIWERVVPVINPLVSLMSDTNRTKRLTKLEIRSRFQREGLNFGDNYFKYFLLDLIATKRVLKIDDFVDVTKTTFYLLGSMDTIEGVSAWLEHRLQDAHHFGEIAKVFGGSFGFFDDVLLQRSIDSMLLDGLLVKEYHDMKVYYRCPSPVGFYGSSES